MKTPYDNGCGKIIVNDNWEKVICGKEHSDFMEIPLCDECLEGQKAYLQGIADRMKLEEQTIEKSYEFFDTDNKVFNGYMVDILDFQKKELGLSASEEKVGTQSHSDNGLNEDCLCCKGICDCEHGCVHNHEDAENNSQEIHHAEGQTHKQSLSPDTQSQQDGGKA